MHDVIQQGLQALAYQNAVTRGIAVLCASTLVYVMAVLWVVVAISRRERVTVAVIARLLVLGALAYAISKVFAHVIVDPRPYLLTHVRPLIPVARDNGFPSDHTLLVAVMAAGMWWIERRLVPAFAAGVVLVMAGRLGVGAHHTLDVLGSVAIVVVASAAAGGLPLPAAWNAAILGQRDRSDVVITPNLR